MRAGVCLPLGFSLLVLPGLLPGAVDPGSCGRSLGAPVSGPQSAAASGARGPAQAPTDRLPCPHVDRVRVGSARPVLLSRARATPPQGTCRALWCDLPASSLLLQTYKHEIIRQWTALELDVLLCPSACPAYSLSAKDFPFGLTSYLCLYNMLDFPAGTLPVSTVTEEDDAELQQFFVGCGRSLNQDFAGSVGLPLSVQCVALPWQEEKALRLMKEVETLMGAAGEPRTPRPPVSV